MKDKKPRKLQVTSHLDKSGQLMLQLTVIDAVLVQAAAGSLPWPLFSSEDTGECTALLSLPPDWHD